MIDNNSLVDIQNQHPNNFIIWDYLGTISSLDHEGRKKSYNGIIISKNLILTAAHSVYSRANNPQKLFHNQIQFDIKGPKKLYEIQSFRFPVQYKQCDEQIKSFYNLAFIKIKQNFPYQKFYNLQIICQHIKKKDIDNLGFETYYPSLGKIISYDGLNCKKRGILGIEMSQEQQKILSMYYQNFSLFSSQVLEYFNLWVAQLDGDHINVSINNICYKCCSQRKKDELSLSQENKLKLRDAQKFLSEAINTSKRKFYDRRYNYECCLKLYRQVLGEKHFKNAYILKCLAETYDSQRQYNRAIDYYKQSITILDFYKAISMDYCHILWSIAMNYKLIHNYNAGIQYYRKLFIAGGKVDDNYYMLQGIQGVAYCNERLQNYRQAKKYYKKSICISCRRNRLVQNATNLSRCLQQLGDKQFQQINREYYQ